MRRGKVFEASCGRSGPPAATGYAIRRAGKQLTGENPTAAFDSTRQDAIKQFSGRLAAAMMAGRVCSIDLDAARVANQPARLHQSRP